ncbi:CHASE2 domain-containing protein [Ohtaekwangia koreensis]|nr:CHASE2 domain-containing protein [Ohtaekwangia koreensis]
MKMLLFIFLMTINLFSCSSQTHENIVLVNVEHLDRAGIAQEISTLNALNPRVIAIDLQFDESRHDEKDTKLVNALWECKNLVMPSLVHNLNGKIFTSSASQLEFSAYAKTGFVNTLPENDTNHTLKRFTVWEKESYGEQASKYHFAARTAMSYDSIKAMKFINAHPKIVDIDYKEGKRQFKILSAKEVLDGKVTKKDIEGKIVMISFLGPGNEDKFYTPLNKHPKEPDMYGVEYLANIVAQILEYNGE